MDHMATLFKVFEEPAYKIPEFSLTVSFMRDNDGYILLNTIICTLLQWINKYLLNNWALSKNNSQVERGVKVWRKDKKIKTE